MYDFLLFFILFSFYFLFSFLLSFFGFFLVVLFTCAVQFMWHGAWRSLLFSELLLQTSNAHFCYYCDYLFMFQAFFSCCFLKKKKIVPHLLSSTAHTVVIYLKTKKLLFALFSTVCFFILSKKSFIVFSSPST